jgi:hypothetical protein
MPRRNVHHDRSPGVAHIDYNAAGKSLCEKREYMPTVDVHEAELTPRRLCVECLAKLPETLRYQLLNKRMWRMR